MTSRLINKMPKWLVGRVGDRGKEGKEWLDRIIRSGHLGLSNRRSRSWRQVSIEKCLWIETSLLLSKWRTIIAHCIRYNSAFFHFEYFVIRTISGVKFCKVVFVLLKYLWTISAYFYPDFADFRNGVSKLLVQEDCNKNPLNTYLLCKRRHAGSFHDRVRIHEPRSLCLCPCHGRRPSSERPSGQTSRTSPENTKSSIKNQKK